MCPDLKGSSIKFANDTGETISTHYSMSIRPCLDADKPPTGYQCESREETKEFLKGVALMVHTYENKINFFEDRASEPYFTKWRRLDFSILEMGKTWWKEYELQKNIIESYDTFFNILGTPQFEKEVFDLVTKYNFKTIPSPGFDNGIYYFGIQLSTTVSINKREAYTLLDLSGDLGGVIEIFTIALGILLSPFAEFLFNLKAIEKLYLAKTND